MKTSKQINTAIDSIGKRAKTWREDVQSTLIDIAGHMVQYGEASLGLKLLNSVGNSANKVALAKWLTTYTAFRMKDDKPSVCNKFVDELVEATESVDLLATREAHEAILARCPMWFEDDGEQDSQVKAVFDALSKAEAFLATLAKKAQKGEGAHLDFERYMRTAIESYKNESLSK